MISTKKVSYENNQLVITIAQTDPAYLHASLMQGIVLSMRSYCTEKNNSDADIDRQLSLLRLLENLLPDESALNEIYGG
jgi:hypothetical protein